MYYLSFFLMSAIVFCSYLWRKYLSFNDELGIQREMKHTLIAVCAHVLVLLTFMAAFTIFAAGYEYMFIYDAIIVSADMALMCGGRQRGQQTAGELPVLLRRD